MKSDVLLACVSLALLGLSFPVTGTAQPKPAAKVKPVFRDFMGLNVHTVLFKAERYQPVCRLVRDYHGFDWDVGADTDYAPRFPLSRNMVNWEQLYGGWKKLGYTTDVSVMFGRTPPKSWKDLPRDAFAYGKSFAQFFGPSGGRNLVESVEIGNEPGHYSDAEYRALFENMAKGVREGDPKLKVVTCNAVPGASGKYEKSLACVQGLERLYDVINVHTYAFSEQYPTWRRSYPEDPALKYLTVVKDTIAWRDKHAPGKEIWITEFGWDASTRPAPASGTFSKWVGVTDTQQAQYLVRSFLAFSTLDVDRAYLYFFDDKDEPQVHGSSGLTRNGVPKPAFHAVAHLYKSLGDYRFSRVVSEQSGVGTAYEYRHTSEPERRVWVAWSPTGSGRTADLRLPKPPGSLERAERMPLTAGEAEVVRPEVSPDDTLRLTVSESPVYLWLKGK